MNRTFKLIAGTLLAAALASAGVPVQAQQWPTKPVTMVNPFAPGGGVDAFGRPLSVYLSKTIGQQFIVENLAGAGGTVGAANAARRPGDGYNFFLGAVHHTIAESLYTKLPYSLERDFVPITVLAYVPNVVVIHPKHADKFKNLKDLIAFAKANPGKLNYGSGGVGSSQHLATEMFKRATGVDIVHVPYKGTAPAELGLMTGDVTLLLDTTACLPFIAAGKMKPLAVASKVRNPALPNVPTLDEVGITGVYAGAWYGVMAPAGTPRAIVERLNRELNAVLAAPEMKKRMVEFGAEIGGGSAESFGQFMASELTRYAEVVKLSGAKVE